jgi:hypothetical protein
MTIKYGLRIKETGEILKAVAALNEDCDFCVDISYTIRPGMGIEWMVDAPTDAEYVRNNSTEWYNASYNTPDHGFKPDDLEVIRIELNIDPIDIKIPTMEEYLKIKYEEEEPKHYKYMMSELEKGEKLKYSVYELREIIREKKWS